MFFEEWESMIHRCIFVSATPGDYEVEEEPRVLVEQIIRPRTDGSGNHRASDPWSGRTICLSEIPPLWIAGACARIT